MNSARVGWQQASKWQRLAIVASAIVVVSVFVPRDPGAAPTPTFAAFRPNLTPSSTREPDVTLPAGAATAYPTTESTQAPTVRPPSSPEPTDPPPLSVMKVTLTGSVCAGCTASVKIKTAANARCSIDVVYDSGSSTAAGLRTKSAGSAGSVAWSWTVGTRTANGTYPIYVACRKGDRFGHLTMRFKVT